MKLWIDDVRPAPEEYVWCKSVNKAKRIIMRYEFLYKDVKMDNSHFNYNIELLDVDHDAGDYAYDGGDYIKLLDWLEETGRNYPIHIHSMNPVGRDNMLAIIRKNNWEYIP